MIDEPVPTMPEMVPAIRPTVRTNRKSKYVPPTRHCERSEAIHRSRGNGLDCSVASLLAMTRDEAHGDTSWLILSCRESKDATGFSARSLEFEEYCWHRRIKEFEQSDDERALILGPRPACQADRLWLR